MCECVCVCVCVCVLTSDCHSVFHFVKKIPFSCETSVAHKPQTSSSVPSMPQAAASVDGFPLIKRKVRHKLSSMCCWSERYFILMIRELHLQYKREKNT